MIPPPSDKETALRNYLYELMSRKSLELLPNGCFKDVMLEESFQAYRAAVEETFRNALPK